MQVGVVGYGNVGKSLVDLINSDDKMQLVGIFSRRNLSVEKFVPFKNLRDYENKLDLLFIAQGSYGDVMENVENFCGFNTVDSYDNHQKISAYKYLMNKLNGKKLSLVGVGWDPGVLSVVRAILSFDNTPATIWGKGQSQGHSNALRSILGVLDGVQFTLPKQNALELAKSGVTDGKQLHERLCYVACVENDKGEVEEKIKKMPHYFDGYDTKVIFCSPQEVRKYRQKSNHSGKVVAKGEGYEGQFALDIQNNAQFTAKVMLAYAKAVPSLIADGYLGAKDVLDIPLKYLCNDNLL